MKNQKLYFLDETGLQRSSFLKKAPCLVENEPYQQLPFSTYRVHAFVIASFSGIEQIQISNDPLNQVLFRAQVSQFTEYLALHEELETPKLLFLDNARSHCLLGLEEKLKFVNL